jgi:protein TonB
VALKAHIQSVVILDARVGVDGRVRSVKVLRGHPLLDTAAVEAVRQWRYLPLLMDGEPAEFVLTVTLTFRLMVPQHRAPRQAP